MSRTLPIAAEHREFTVKVNGEPVARVHQLLAASVVHQVNRVSKARLVYLDGTASAGDFPLSGSDTFVPGAEVEVLAGAPGGEEQIFVGVVTRHSVRVREASAPQLIVECQHKAVKLTIGRKSKYYLDKTDSDAIGEILSDAGLDGDVTSTSVSHPHLVQYNSTHWDFLLLRARANGLVVLTDTEQVRVKEPLAEGSPACTLTYGSTILDFDADIDARTQLAAVKGLSWDAAQQALVERDGADPALNDPGNLSPADLAAVVGPDVFTLRHPALPEEELQAWADARWRRAQLCRVNGRASCQGIATVRPGGAVELAGLGDRVNGTAYVSGVRHELDLVKGWRTHVQLGSADTDLVGEDAVTAPAAGALLPAVLGLQVGVVVSNEDPDGEHRVRVRMPLIDPDDEGTWARVAAPDAGDTRGFFFRPEVNDEVVLGFFDGDPRSAVILGMLNSSAKPAPLEGSDDNHEKVLQTRSGCRLYFNDDTKVIVLETPGGNKMSISDEDSGITLEDQNGNQIVMNADGILLKSASAVNIEAATDIKAESGANLELKAGAQLVAEGSAGSELKSTATTVIKGSLIQIN